MFKFPVHNAQKYNQQKNALLSFSVHFFRLKIEFTFKFDDRGWKNESVSKLTRISVD